MNYHILVRISCIIFLVLSSLAVPYVADEEIELNQSMDTGDIPDPLPTETVIPTPEAMPGPVDDFPPTPDPEPEVIGGDTGWYQITSTPSGAEAIFDGSDIGITPVTAEVYVTSTPYHTVRVEKSGFKPWTRELNENPGSGETITIHANLVPDPCCMSLRITSGPSGARILLNGVFQGYTPKTIENLMVGTYQVMLSREGYESWFGSIEVGPDEENRIYVILEPMFAPITSATLMVDSNPSGAEIVLDGTNRGTTPRSLTLPEGSHALVLSHSGYQQYTTSLFLRDKENSQIYAELIPSGSTSTPVIIATPVTQTTFSPEELIHQGDMAAGFLSRKGFESLLSEINSPDGQFHNDDGFVSVLAENGTILAYPGGSEWLSENSTSYTDQNMVPYGQVRIALAKAEGGLIYENDISNSSTGGQLLLTAVRPESEDLIISASHPLGIPVPVFSSATISSLTTPDKGQGAGDPAIWEAIISSDGSDMSEESIASIARFNQTDQFTVRALPVITALASQGGGLCYITEPSGSDIALAYISPEYDGQIAIRWVAGTGTETQHDEVMHT